MHCPRFLIGTGRGGGGQTQGRADLDGSNVTTVFTGEGAGNINGLALDIAAGKLQRADLGRNRRRGRTG
jgi:hypothetical protein